MSCVTPAISICSFLHRHPRAILTSERLAAYVGYDLNQLARSLDLLADAGLLERSQHPTHAARLYVLTTPESGWLRSVMDIASTREGRETLMRTIKTAAEQPPASREPAREDGAGARASTPQTNRREVAMADADLVKTGITGLDPILGGGSPGATSSSSKARRERENDARTRVHLPRRRGI